MKYPLALLLCAIPLLALAHDGEDHGAPPPLPTQALAPRAIASSDEVEAVAILDGKKLFIYLDRFGDNAAITRAKVELDGSAIKGVASETTPGVYSIKLPDLKAGKHALTISIDAGEVQDLLSATLDTSLPANAPTPGSWWEKLKAKWAGPSPAKPTSITVAGHHAAPQRLPDGSLFIPKTLQRQLGLRTQIANIGALSATLELNGSVIADPATGGRVQAAFGGSIVPTAKGLPLPGQKVAKGEILAWLRPLGGSIERANQQAQQAELEAQLAIAGQRLARYQQLEGAVAQKDIDSAKIEHAALKRRRDFVKASLNSNEALRATSSGVISRSHVVAGQVVDAKELLFDIVDGAHLAVEALAYDSTIPARLISASALGEQGALELGFIGSGAMLREQALPLLFRIKNPGPNPNPGTSANLIGQPLKVIVRTNKNLQGAALPRSALFKSANGETQVWVHAEAERFIARKVRQQALDGNHVAIIDGLHQGERIIINGATSLAEVR